MASKQDLLCFVICSIYPFYLSVYLASVAPLLTLRANISLQVMSFAKQKEEDVDKLLLSMSLSNPFTQFKNCVLYLLNAFLLLVSTVCKSCVFFSLHFHLFFFLFFSELYLAYYLDVFKEMKGLDLLPNAALIVGVVLISMVVLLLSFQNASIIKFKRFVSCVFTCF